MLVVLGPLVLLLLLSPILSTTTEAKSIWDVEIFRDPAPDPSKGPPLSANASRDPADLKFEVIGILVATLAWTLLTVLAIYLVGRRRRRIKDRREYQTSGIKMQQLKPPGGVTVREMEPPLKSPSKFSLKSWKKGHREKGSEMSVSSIDTRVVETDKMHNMDDLAKLYAAVMAHDEEKSIASKSADTSPVLYAPPTPRTPKSPVIPHEHFPPHYRPPFPQSPAQCQRHELASEHTELPYPTHFYPPEPETILPSEARYPRAYQQDLYHQRSLSGLAEYSEPPLAVADHDEQALLGTKASPRKNRPAALSVAAAGTRIGSPLSQKARPSPITVHGRAISNPLGSATLSSAQTPTITLYNPGPPPPTPGRQKETSIPTPISKTEAVQDPAPSYTPSHTAPASAPRVRNNTLPFRQYQNTDPLRSAPPTKTTFVDRRVSALNGPRTGVPMTPYSPYQPQTPMTPITPRTLLNKQQLKEARKQYNLKSVAENDIVQDEEDMWGTVE